jgi:hypothetical protein
MTVEHYKEPSGERVQSSLYWLSAAFATIVYLLIIFFFLMVPGGNTSEKVWTLSSVGLLLASSLAIGLWGFRTRDVPAMRWPAGPPVAAVLALELAHCVTGLVVVIAKMKF